MYTINDLRNQQYENHSRLYPYIDDWVKNPYTFLKARFYMESSAVLVYILLKTKIKPNTISIVYGLLGIVTGVLLSIPNNYAICLALVIAFTKGILDWSDGHLARLTGQTSVTGHVLDVYGALLNDLGLQMGLGYYVASQTGNPIFYYLIPLIPFFFAVKFKVFSDTILFEELSKKSFIKNRLTKIDDTNNADVITGSTKASVLGRYEKYYRYFSNIFDGRARSVDFICLLILIEMYVAISLTWIVFIFFIVKGFISFIAGYYITIRKELITKWVDAIILNIKNTDKGDN